MGDSSQTKQRFHRQYEDDHRDVYKRPMTPNALFICLDESPKQLMAEIELNVLSGQCLTRQIDNTSEVKKELTTWQKARKTKNAKANWQFTTKDARIKLKRLYPTLDS